MPYTPRQTPCGFAISRCDLDCAECPYPPRDTAFWVPEHPQVHMYRAREPQPVGKLGEGRDLLTATIHEALWFTDQAACEAWIATNPTPAFVAREHMIVDGDHRPARREPSIAQRLTGWTRRDLLNAETGSPGKAGGFAVLPGTTPR